MQVRPFQPLNAGHCADADCAGLVERAVHDAFGPHVSAQICWWHARKNMERNLKSVWPRLEPKMQLLHDCVSELTFNALWADIETEFGESGPANNPTMVVDYLKKTWISKAKRWAAFYVQKAMNLGKVSSQMSESMNSLFKHKYDCVQSLQVGVMFHDILWFFPCTHLVIPCRALSPTS